MNKRIAVLDMYNDTPNQGMRCIKELIEDHHAGFEYEIFNVRAKAEVPDLSFDAYISTGGPGDPLEGDGIWDKQYFQWLSDLWEHNQKPYTEKKYALFICHSFQMAADFFKLGKITKRKSMSFGTFPVHKTETGKKEPFFDGLPDPFFVADFRQYQLVQPDFDRLEEMDAHILCLEKIRPHIQLERAIMAIRFSEDLFGVQFHPEADPDGMTLHFQDATRKKNVIDSFGHSKYQEMIDHLNDPDKIPLTHNTVIPKFLDNIVRVMV